MENKNTGLVVLVIILSLLVLGLCGFIIYDKVISNNKDLNKNDSVVNDIITNDDNTVNYNFGDEVVISNLSSVKDYYYPGDIQDFSKWYVLSSKEENVTLLSKESWGKFGKIYVNDTIFKEYDVNIIEIRGLNENELNLLSCNIDTLKCDNLPEWGRYTLTSVEKDGYIISIGEDSLSKFDNKGAIAPVKYVIKIKKSEIN